MMRRLLLVAALAVASSPFAASALPPDCERYGDKPCFMVCEFYEDIEALFEETPVSNC